MTDYPAVKENWQNEGPGVSDADSKPDAEAMNAVARLLNECRTKILGLSNGKQKQDNTLDGLAALNWVADTLIYGTGDDTAGRTAFTPFSRQTLALADAAAYRGKLVVPSKSEMADAIAAAGGSYGGSVSDIYNAKPEYMRRLQRSMGNAFGQIGFSDHLLIGDSQTSSFTGLPDTPGGPNFAAMWGRKMRDIVSNRGIPLGGTGVVFANDTTGVNDDRWTFPSGNWIDGYGYRQANGTASALFTSDVLGTSITVYYIDIAWMPSFKIKVNNLAEQTIYPNDANGKISSVKVDIGTMGLHKVLISGTNHFILGAACTANYGFRMHMAAQQGARAGTTWGAASFGDFTTRAFAVSKILPDPDVLHIQLGANDIGHGETSEATIGYLRAIRQRWPSSDCILYAQYETNATTGWGTHTQNLYALANELQCPLIDMYKRSGGFNYANSKKMMINDGLHMTNGAEADQGSVSAGLVLNGR